MINVEDDVKKAYEESTIQVDRIILDGQPYRISKVNYTDDCYEEGNVFGTVIARSLEFEIDSISLEKKEFEYQTGIYVNNEIKWTSLGNFITQDEEPNNTTGTNKVTAMDYMLKSNVEYKSELDYSSGKITMLDVMKEACNQAGLELATVDFANNNFIVDSNQFEKNILIRQVFKAVAQMAGAFAKIRYDNKVYLINPKKRTGILVKEVHAMPVKELNKLPVQKLSVPQSQYPANSYKELIVKRNTNPINLVSLGISDIEGENATLSDEQSIAKYGENALVINDNPFAYTQEKREQLITALFNAVKGFDYISYEIQGQSKPYVETGDEVIVIDKDRNVFHTFLFRFNYKSPNGLESEMSAPSIIKATVDYKNMESALEIGKRAERRIDKMEGVITDIIEEQTETETKLSEHKQTIDEMQDTISQVDKKVDGTKEELSTQITQTAEGVKSEVTKSITDAKKEAIDSANSSTDSKLEKYTTTVQSLIDQKSNTILATVSADYATKTSLDNVNKTLTASLELKVDTKNLISAINASADRISLTAGRLVITAGNFQLDASGNITATGGKIGGFNISSTYLANGTTTLAGANNSVYLGTNGISCGTAFKVTNTGAVTCSNISITGGNLKIGDNFSVDNKGQLICSNANVIGNITANSGKIGNFNIENGWLEATDGNILTEVSSSGFNIWDTDTVLGQLVKLEIMSINFDGKNTRANFGGVAGGKGTVTTDILNVGTINQTSLESLKKNISKFDKNAIEIIKNGDIYQYNYKTEKDTDKKHIGFVIGENYMTPDEVISSNRDGIDAYSQRSILWKGIQELLEIIGNLQKRITILEGSDI